MKAIWNGEEFAKVRYYHETGQWDKVPFCTNCNGWAQYEYEEEIRDGFLIRRSPEFTYYNRIDRLKNWKGQLLGGHDEPPGGLIEIVDALSDRSLAMSLYVDRVKALCIHAAWAIDVTSSF